MTVVSANCAKIQHGAFTKDSANNNGHGGIQPTVNVGLSVTEVVGFVEDVRSIGNGLNETKRKWLIAFRRASCGHISTELTATATNGLNRRSNTATILYQLTKHCMILI